MFSVNLSTGKGKKRYDRCINFFLKQMDSFKVGFVCLKGKPQGYQSLEFLKHMEDQEIDVPRKSRGNYELVGLQILYSE